LEKEYIYDAFISYRHTALDRTIADKLQKRLERYKPPSSALGGRGFKKLRIFRDETELPTSSNLSDDIRNALENSRFLIVLCSKTTKQSKWCMQEINHFKEIHGGMTDKIVTVLTEGEPADVFPIELCTETRTIIDDDGTERKETVDIEPLAANVSALTIKESLKKLKREFLRVAAPLYGCGFDALYNRNQRRFVRRVVTISAAMVLFLTAFGIYSSAMIIQINRQRIELEQKTIELEEGAIILNEANTALANKNDELDSANTQLEQTNNDLLIEESRFLSKESALQLEADDRIGAIRSALSALPTGTNDRPWTPQAEFALSQALSAYSNASVRIDRRLDHSSSVVQVLYNNDGTRIASRDSQGNLYIWDPDNGERIGYFSASADFTSKDLAVSNSNLLFSAANRSVVCIDLTTADILWKREHTFDDRSFFSDRIILSHDGRTAVAVSFNGVLFINTSDGEVLFHKRLREDDFGTVYLDNNGTFSTDDKMFYISTSQSSFSGSGGGDIEPGRLFRIDMETNEVSTYEFGEGSRGLGIYADEAMEILAVRDYNGTGQDILFTFSRQTQTPMWTYVLTANSVFRSSAFIYHYNSLILVAYGNTTFLLRAETGELVVADALPSNILLCEALPDIPHIVVAILENGEIYRKWLSEESIENLYLLNTLWQKMGSYWKDLYTVDFFRDLNRDDMGISFSLDYSFVQRQSSSAVLIADFGQSFISIATYVEDRNYLGIGIDPGLNSNPYDNHISFSENSQLIVYTAGNKTDGFKIFIADTLTGDVLYERNISKGDPVQLSFNNEDNIVLYCTEGIEIIDWRYNTIVFEFDTNEADAKVSTSVSSSWNVTVSGNMALYIGYSRDSRFLVDTNEKSYKVLNIIRNESLSLSHHALNSNGDLAIYLKERNDDNGSIIIVTSDSRKLLDNDFTKKELGIYLSWSDDGTLLAAVNSRDEAIIYDSQSLEKIHTISLYSPAGITITPDNRFLLSLGVDGVLYEYSLFDIGKVRQLKVFDRAFSSLSPLKIEMFNFLTLDGRQSMILTSDENSFIIDLDEFTFRAEIKNLGAYSEAHRMFAQHGSSIRVRNFYRTEELIEMAQSVLSHSAS